MISTKYLKGYTLALTMMLAGACTKVGLVSNDNTPQPKFSNKSKVLVIVVDGLSGFELKKAVPPVIRNLMQHSTYSYESLADSVTNDGSSWANIMTGVGVAKNNIWDSTLTPHSASGARYAPFLSLLKKTNQRTLKTVSVTGWEQLNKTLLADVVTKVTTKDDDLAVRDSAVAHLRKDSIDLMFTHFSSINKAGKAAAFSASEPAYASAITNVDGYIGNLVEALKSRPDFANENWLVIVQSTHGGIENTYGGDSYEEMNCFSLFYCPDLFPQQVDMPQAIKYSVHMSGQDAGAVNAVLADNKMYNFGNKGNYTIECKMRTANPGFWAQYPAFLSKRASFNQRVPGWCFFQEGSFWQINFGRKSGSNRQCKGADINDGRWHQATAVIYTDAANKRWVKTFTDGVYNRKEEITDVGDINNTAPLTMGFIPGSIRTPVDMYMSDVRIWADSLPADAIAKYSCTNVIDASHPYYSKLIGYWPCKERKGPVFRNMAPGAQGKNFQIKGGYTWDLLDYVLPCASNIGLQTPPYSTEVFYQIAYWLNLQISSEWEIKGRLWLKFF